MKKLVIFLCIIIGLLLLFSELAIIQLSHVRRVVSSKNALTITSPIFSEGKQIPTKYSCDLSSVNPPLIIANVPSNAKSLVLIMDDPDALTGTFVHWIVYNIPPDTKQIDEDSIPKSALQGKNGAGKAEYIGPCPPSGTHHYVFTLYALDTTLRLPSEPERKALETAIQGHIITISKLSGLFTRT